jgi:hypothetical protein
MDSPLLLHMQHQSITMTCHFLKLSKVGVFPNAAVQTKESHSRGGLPPSNALPRERKTSWGAKRMIKISDIERPPFGRDPENYTFLKPKVQTDTYFLIPSQLTKGTFLLPQSS